MSAGVTLAVVCACLVGCAAAFDEATQIQGKGDANLSRFERPLNVCTASVHNFGITCRGAPRSYRPDPHHNCPAAASGGRVACGYDVDLWTRSAERLGLREGADYVHVCLGDDFANLISNLQNETRPADVPRCDVGLASITETSQRKDAGIEFSQVTYRNKLAVLVTGRIESRGMWAFFQPLDVSVWLALLGTIFVVPLFVFFCEYIIMRRHFNYSANKDMAGAGSWAANLKEAVWHSLAYTMSIDVFVVSSSSARIVVVAYCFMTLIISNTYTANLAAFLTARIFKGGISSPDELSGKAVATLPTYVERIWQQHGIRTFAEEGWDFDATVARLQSGVYAAAVLDASQVLEQVQQDERCSLHVLAEDLGEFDLAFAFRAGFSRDYPGVVDRISHELLLLNEAGVTEEIERRYLRDTRQCGSIDFDDEQPHVTLRDLMGLWLMLAGAIVAAMLVGAAARCLGLVPAPPDPTGSGGEADKEASTSGASPVSSVPGKREAHGAAAQVALYVPAQPNVRAEAVQRLGKQAE